MAVTCKMCSQRAATVHFTEIVNGKMVSLHLCAECARDKGIEVQSASSYGMGDLVAGLIDTSVDTEAEKIGRVRCPACSFEFSEFKKVGRFGCPECYDAFVTQLMPMLRHIHGATQHRGKAPAHMRAQIRRDQTRAELEEDLREAVREEDFERAANLRDRIRSLTEEEGAGNE